MDGASAVGVAGGAASMLPVLFGRGQNKQLAKGFAGQKGHDPNAAFYGGQQGGLQAYNSQLGQKQSLVEGRGAFTANYGQADQDRAMGLQARGGQQTLANAMQARALGQTPSIAQMQADRQMQQATAAQASASASARGPAAMALAQQNAANNTANMQSSISNQAQINAAQERQQAEQAAFGAFSGMRGQDLGSQGQTANQAQFQAQMQQQNRNANDQRAMGYEQLSGRANEAELAARTQNQGTLAGSQSAADTANQKTADQNAQSKGIIESIGDFFSDERAKIMLSGSGMVSDTRAKRSALLAEGRRQGANAASFGGPSLDAMLDDRAKGPYGANADSAALDDRAAQHADRGIGRAALDNAIGEQVEQDKAGGDSAIDQWKRSFGDPEDAANAVRDSDNRAEAARIRARFSDPGVPPAGASGGAPPAAPWWAGIGAASKSLSDAQFSRPQGMLSDETAKTKPDGSGSTEDVMARLHQVHDIKSVGELNRESMRTPGVAKAMAPGSPVATSDDEYASALSDMRGKDVLPLYEPAGKQLHQSKDGHAFLADEPSNDDGRPSLAGPTPRYSKHEAPKGQPQKAASKRREMTPEEMLAWADRTEGEMGSDHAHRMANGPSVMVSDERAKRMAFQEGAAYATKNITGKDMIPWKAGDESEGEDSESPNPLANYVAPDGPNPLPAPPPPRAARKLTSFERDNPVAEANRSMVGSAYAYKPGLTPSTQRPGEVNVGPMAQNLEKSPVAGTAVKTDPATGLKVIDRDKALKVVMTGVADLQRQQDETRSMLLAEGGRRRK